MCLVLLIYLSSHPQSCTIFYGRVNWLCKLISLSLSPVWRYYHIIFGRHSVDTHLSGDYSGVKFFFIRQCGCALRGTFTPITGWNPVRIDQSRARIRWMFRIHNLNETQEPVVMSMSFFWQPTQRASLTFYDCAPMPILQKDGATFQRIQRYLTASIGTRKPETRRPLHCAAL